MHADCGSGDPFTAEALRDRVAALAAPELDGRAPGTPGDRAARAIVVEQLACLGLEPAGDRAGSGSAAPSFEQAFTASGGARTANILALVRGTDPAAGIVLVTAHVDHLGSGHLGANDDASGVAALLAIAGAAHGAGPQPRTIAFAVFGDEEGGMVGSTFFTAHPPPELPIADLVQVVELDMVGSHDSAGLVGAMGAFAGTPQRAQLDAALPAVHGIHVAAGGKARGSDFAPFCALGVPYTFFWTPDRRCYHQTCDTIDRLDVRHMSTIARLAGALVQRLATTKTDLVAWRAKHGCGGMIAD